MLLSVLTGLFGVLLLIGIIIKFIWWILGAVALVVLFFIPRSAVRWYDERRATEARYRDGLAAPPISSTTG